MTSLIQQTQIPSVRPPGLLSPQPQISWYNVKFSWQKNHGEEKLLSSNPRNPSRDALRSLHNIVSRFARIVGLDKTDIPLAVYKGSFGEKFFIHSKVIASTLRTLAKKTYNLTDRNLQQHYKCTFHSLHAGASVILQAGAAVILHAAGINAIQIKFLLCWRSNSFFLYLRNVAHLSEQQNRAINQLASATQSEVTAARAASRLIPNIV
ncbi:unnamed protein product [Cylindrotheca closterium]|uniref:Uncharacterized protein n=1 Tax=Cylindrotheca closterium TaxID=2856 RepID=A0AAD2FD91_9STRA|nr:unnamed protein product [Cylindrotheca closterium]